MKTPVIHILLATYNGSKYLNQQLESIANQSYNEWTLTVSDDGSTDNTCELIENFSKRAKQRVNLIQGPKSGSSTANFFNLIKAIENFNDNDLFAFCDQDDVWLKDKLSVSVIWHNKKSHHTARLYCGRTYITDENLRCIGASPIPTRPIDFGNAVVQNIASGNTMVMSSAVLNTLKKLKPEHSVWHDWSTYIVVTAMGGIVEFDKTPYLLYRQHNDNVIGINSGLKAQILRLIPIFNGRYKLWSELTERSILDIIEDIHSDMITTFNYFRKIRAATSPYCRLVYWGKSKIRRQTLISNLSLATAIALRLF